MTFSFRDMCFQSGIIKIAHWADEFSRDALERMLSISCKCRSSKKINRISWAESFSPIFHKCSM